MPQPGFFDLGERYERLSRLGYPLLHIQQVVDWEGFRPPRRVRFPSVRGPGAVKVQARLDTTSAGLKS
jgi:hypothetical protein